MKQVQRIFKHFSLVLPIVLLTSCGLGNSPEKILKHASEEANKTCPVRVDEMTVLKETFYENHCFYYIYELDNVPDSEIFMEIDDEVLEDYLCKEIKENARVNSDVRAFHETLRQDNAKLIHRYVMTDGSGRMREFEVEY